MKEFKNRNTEFHTYKSKQERSFRVVLNYMHATANDIKKEMTNLEHTSTNKWNIKKALKRPFIFSISN